MLAANEQVLPMVGDLKNPAWQPKSITYSKSENLF